MFLKKFTVIYIQNNLTLGPNLQLIDSSMFWPNCKEKLL